MDTLDTTQSKSIIAQALSTVSSDQVTISYNNETFTAYAAKGLATAVNDIVMAQRVGAVWYVTSVLKTTAPTPDDTNDPVPTAKPATRSGRLTVAPVETRSYRGGKWRTDTTDTLQGEYGGYGNSTGCAFYGSLPRTLTGATVVGANIRVRRDRAGDFAARTATLRLVTEAYRPAGAPTLGSSTTGPSLKVGELEPAFIIPNSWAQAMVDGTAGGLAIFDADGSPYIRFAGKGEYGPAWTMNIYWTK